jgi:hypothetical protein
VLFLCNNMKQKRRYPKGNNANSVQNIYEK